MSQTITSWITIEATTCGECGVHFGMDAGQLSKRREDGHSFYCPNGHKLSFHVTEADRLRKRLELAERREANLDESLRSERASHAATKGHLTRVRKRADKGVCQHCHRSFANVARHVASKHPDTP